jgi:PilZ domain-containing protein
MSISRQQDRRHHPRTRVAWSVVVTVGTSRYLSSSVDVSTHGAKVRTKARLKTGSTVQLEIVPPEGPPLRVGALLWRIDADGLAFLFSHAIEHRLIRAIWL